MYSPLVSVIVPAYNAEKYILETIKSVQAQTYSKWEMIIVDDGSTDNTAEIIKQASEKDTRIQYYFQTNGKQSKARNNGIKKSKGELLAFLDADDLWKMDKLEKQLNIFKLYEIDLVFTQGWILNENEINNFQEINTPIGLQEKGAFLKKLLLGYSPPTTSIMVKKTFVNKVNGFQELKMVLAQDYNLWLRLSDIGCQFYGLHERLFYYRIHINQVTYNNSYAFLYAIWSAHEAKLKSVSKILKRKILIYRVYEFLIHNIDILPRSNTNEIIYLFNKPLNAKTLYLFNRILLSLGVVLFKKYHYRFTLKKISKLNFSIKIIF